MVGVKVNVRPRVRVMVLYMSHIHPNLALRDYGSDLLEFIGGFWLGMRVEQRAE